MEENSNIVRLRHADEIDDPLTNILRSGARRLLAQAVEFEADAFLAGMKDLKLADGRDRVVRHGRGQILPSPLTDDAHDPDERVHGASRHGATGDPRHCCAGDDHDRPAVGGSSLFR